MHKNTKIMAILNVTPDSFSDGGKYESIDSVRKQVSAFIKEGADIIDVGGESTRPFAEPISIDDELERVIPAIRIIRDESAIRVSVDTTKATVAREAIKAGADIINDISALRKDSEMIEVAKQYPVHLIIMHMQGVPKDMQVEPHYQDVVIEINDFFSERLAWLEEQGIKRERITIDPGIGFGKTLDHNIELLRNIPVLKKHGCPVLIGHSRKSFFEHLLGATMEERDTLTAVISALCAANGADILRVHSVLDNVRAVKLATLLSGGQA